ncbi:sensor domain-containing diguanylate cyclase [Algiphilus aromaticivorans]|uniref:sensor domain-containing diguanylate cyclase n=1 Tax=Algiphilus aromaticivorans TaxID=382454 RepID=UPI0006935EC8|nr:sensor domain-containing diguanylate cyclase [Algiphilus aromaticivorans]
MEQVTRNVIGRLDIREQLELAQHISNFGVYHLDREGRIRSWNPGAVKLTGLSADAAIGAPYAQLFHEDGRRNNQPQQALEFCRAYQHLREEQMRARADGSFFTADVSMDLARADSGEIRAFVEVFEDITEAKQREEALYRQATRDALTGVANRGHFGEVAGKEIERALRFHEPLSMALLDIDHFKQVNDTYGHEPGDRALIAFAQETEANVRSIDLLGRIGGEEFALMLPRANASAAAEMLQRLRQVVAAIRVSADVGQVFGFTMSVGVSELRPQARSQKDLLREADAALYRAKREGRNQVQIWRDYEPQRPRR